MSCHVTSVAVINGEGTELQTVTVFTTADEYIELAICPSAKAGLSSGGGTTTTKYKDRLSSWGKMGGRGKKNGLSIRRDGQG